MTTEFRTLPDLALRCAAIARQLRHGVEYGQVSSVGQARLSYLLQLAEEIERRVSEVPA